MLAYCVSVLAAEGPGAGLNLTGPASSLDTAAAVRSTASPAQFEIWRSQIRTALSIPTPLPPLKPVTFGNFSPMPGVVVHRVTYGTEFGMRIPALVYTPEPTQGKLPAVVVVAGHGGDKTTWYSVYTGMLFAKAGGVVLTYDPIGEGERNADRRSDARAHDAVIPGSDAAVRTGGLMITDILQAVSYLRTLPNVDADRIAVAGYSMGSLQSALAAAVDPRIKTLILSGGGNLDGNGGSWDTENKPMCQAGIYNALSFLPDKGAILYALHQRVGPTLILNGRLDPLVGRPHHFEEFFADLAERVAVIAGPAAAPIQYRFLAEVGHRPSWVTLEAAEWLNSNLHFPNWTEIPLSSVGSTHISAWAAATGVHINTGYTDEIREGGIVAVGKDFPGIPRGQLAVVPLTVWRRHQDLYIWQAWQNHILRAEGLPLSMAVAPPPPR